MKYIKTMTQLKLSIWLALYIGWFMNAAVFFRRFEGYAQEFTIWKGLSGAVELIGTFLVTFFLLRICRCLAGGSGVSSRPSSYSSPPPPAIT